MVGEQPAQQRSDDRRDPEDRADRALVLAPLPQRDDVGDQRHRRHHQAARADALDRPPDDQQRHVRRQPAQERAGDEHDRGHLEDHLAAEQVAELADQHRRHGLREQVRGHHPGHVLGTAQVRHDRGQRGAHDRLVQGREQHAEHDRDEDDVAAPTVQHGRLDGGGPWRFLGDCHAATITPVHRPRMRGGAARVRAGPVSARRGCAAAGRCP